MTSNFSLPVDIPWKRLATSSDMIDTQHGDRKFPPKWRSSISMFYHEPEDAPETYCNRNITYLKIVSSITGYQPGTEIGSTDPLNDDRWKWEVKNLGEPYWPCYGAQLQVGVYPPDAEDERPLSEYPYIVDFEPKKRELYESVTESGEVVDRSSSSLNVRNSNTNTETTSVSEKHSAEVHAGISPGLEGGFGGGVKGSTERTKERAASIQLENVNTTDTSRENRETRAATTNLSQMYQLFTGYHLGSNRATFYIIPRPHIQNEKDKYTFINGPRQLEGIQEIFLVVNRPKEQPSICVEAFLETGHLDLSSTEPRKDKRPIFEKYGGLEPTSTVTRTVNETVSYMSTLQVPLGNLEGYEIDNSKGGKKLQITHFDLETKQKEHRSIDLPKGFDLQGGVIGAGIWLSWVRIYPDDNQNWYAGFQFHHPASESEGERNFKAQCNLYVKQKDQKPEPEPGQPEEKTFYVTSRGLSACTLIEEVEAERRHQSVDFGTDWDTIFHTDTEEQLHDWLVEYQPLSLEELVSMRDKDKDEYQQQVRETVQQNYHQLPEKWKYPNEWVSYETEMPVSASMHDAETDVQTRIRTANNLTHRIGRELIESHRSFERYEDRKVTFWETDIALKRISDVLSLLPDGDPNNVPVSELNLASQLERRIVSVFGDDVRRRDLARLDLDELQQKLRISEVEARSFKFDLFRKVINPERKPVELEQRSETGQQKQESDSTNDS